ncbi:uncharacterized protein LOC135923291 [Gordionus sp. m RMFG-2023]|uniref:uncharacterized protein LOC135923291 n=1 Tax=Gordionus sp. m RMFG-2023 TaxID=3053472 RepID=UPI0031FDE261
MIVTVQRNLKISKIRSDNNSNQTVPPNLLLSQNRATKSLDDDNKNHLDAPNSQKIQSENNDGQHQENDKKLETYLTLKGAAINISNTQIKRNIDNNSRDDITLHLQKILDLLRPQDDLKLAVKLESNFISDLKYTNDQLEDEFLIGHPALVADKSSATCFVSKMRYLAIVSNKDYSSEDENTVVASTITNNNDKGERYILLGVDGITRGIILAPPDLVTNLPKDKNDMNGCAKNTKDHINANANNGNDKTKMELAEYRQVKSCEFSVGLALPFDPASTRITLDGDGAILISPALNPPPLVDLYDKDNLEHSKDLYFKPICVRAMWCAAQCLHELLFTSGLSRQRSSPSYASSLEHYDSLSRRAPDPVAFREWRALPPADRSPACASLYYDLASAHCYWTQTTKTNHLSADNSNRHFNIKTLSRHQKSIVTEALRRVMSVADPEEATFLSIRHGLERELAQIGPEWHDGDLSLHRPGELKAFVEERLLLILGRMDRATPVTTNLYLGSEWNASNLEELRANRIGYIINVTKEIENFFPDIFFYQNIRVADDELSNLLPHWDKTYKFISRAIKKGQRSGTIRKSPSPTHLSHLPFYNPFSTPLLEKSEKFHKLNNIDRDKHNIERDTNNSTNNPNTGNHNILVHCKMGISRSASVVIAYVMKSQRLSYDIALSLVRSKRPCVQPNPNFERQLLTYQGILRASHNRQIMIWRSKSESNLKPYYLNKYNHLTSISSENNDFLSSSNSQDHNTSLNDVNSIKIGNIDEEFDDSNIDNNNNINHRIYYENGEKKNLQPEYLKFEASSKFCIDTINPYDPKNEYCTPLEIINNSDKTLTINTTNATTFRGIRRVVSFYMETHEAGLKENFDGKSVNGQSNKNIPKCDLEKKPSPNVKSINKQNSSFNYNFIKSKLAFLCNAMIQHHDHRYKEASSWSRYKEQAMNNLNDRQDAFMKPKLIKNKINMKVLSNPEREFMAHNKGLRLSHSLHISKGMVKDKTLNFEKLTYNSTPHKKGSHNFDSYPPAIKRHTWYDAEPVSFHRRFYNAATIIDRNHRNIFAIDDKINLNKQHAFCQNYPETSFFPRGFVRSRSSLIGNGIYNNEKGAFPTHINLSIINDEISPCNIVPSPKKGEKENIILNNADNTIVLNSRRKKGEALKQHQYLRLFNDTNNLSNPTIKSINTSSEMILKSRKSSVPIGRRLLNNIDKNFKNENSSTFFQNPTLKT